VQTAPSEQQIQQYREQGFVVVEGLLDAAELAHWRADHRSGHQTPAGQRHPSTTNPTQTRSTPRSSPVLNLRDLHPAMMQLIAHPVLGKWAGLLAGVDGIRIWQDQALVKQPYSNPTALHFDDPFWSFYSHDSVNMWLPLDDATLANGCLWYLPGTHKEARFELVDIDVNIGGIFKTYPQWKQLEAVPTPCPAGSVIFHNGLIAHGAGPNMTPRPRRAMTAGYMPDGMVFNGQQSLLPEAYFKSLTVGDLLNDDAMFPLIWQRA
jgi:ectoine hydroxylase-related dioxygenase (phytanoyl-CoA dioxygenase family)